MIPLPYFEDIYSIYINYIFQTLYPDNINNKLIVYIIATFHILGTLMITYGIFLPPKYQPLFLFYLILISCSYLIFKGHCFMTLLANKYSGIHESPLHIRMKTAQSVLFVSIILSVITIINPNLSVYRIFQYLFSPNQ